MNAGCHMYLANGNKMNPIEKMLKEKNTHVLYQKYLTWMQEKNG